MQIGKLDKSILLQSCVETNDAGDVTTSWVDVGTVYAHIKTQRGNEAFEAARVVAKETLRVLIRYRADIDVTWRMQWGGKYYNVSAVDQSEHRKGETWFTAELANSQQA